MASSTSWIEQPKTGTSGFWTVPRTVTKDPTRRCSTHWIMARDEIPSRSCNTPWKVPSCWRNTKNTNLALIRRMTCNRAVKNTSCPSMARFMSSIRVRNSRGRVADCIKGSSPYRAFMSGVSAAADLAISSSLWRRSVSENISSLSRLRSLRRCWRTNRFCWFLLKVPEEESSETSSDEEI